MLRFHYFLDWQFISASPSPISHTFLILWTAQKILIHSKILFYNTYSRFKTSFYFFQAITGCVLQCQRGDWQEGTSWGVGAFQSVPHDGFWKSGRSLPSSTSSCLFTSYCEYLASRPWALKSYLECKQSLAKLLRGRQVFTQHWCQKKLFI